jgi:hypothetical protein
MNELLPRTDQGIQSFAGAIVLRNVGTGRHDAEMLLVEPEPWEYRGLRVPGSFSTRPEEELELARKKSHELHKALSELVGDDCSVDPWAPLFQDFGHMEEIQRGLAAETGLNPQGEHRIRRLRRTSTWSSSGRSLNNPNRECYGYVVYPGAVPATDWQSLDGQGDSVMYDAGSSDGPPTISGMRSHWVNLKDAVGTDLYGRASQGTVEALEWGRQLVNAHWRAISPEDWGLIWELVLKRSGLLEAYAACTSEYDGRSRAACWHYEQARRAEMLQVTLRERRLPVVSSCIKVELENACGILTNQAYSRRQKMTMRVISVATRLVMCREEVRLYLFVNNGPTSSQVHALMDQVRLGRDEDMRWSARNPRCVDMALLEHEVYHGMAFFVPTGSAHGFL